MTSPEHRSGMLREEDRGESDPRWRAILEARWRDRLEELTELSLAYHSAADAAGNVADKHARQVLRRAVAARRRLADTEEALGRLTAGHFGRCEQCQARIPLLLLTAAPESRYCTDCAAPTTTPTTTGKVATGVPRPGAGGRTQVRADRHLAAGRR
jgi:DnaK suppressor protein